MTELEQYKKRLLERIEEIENPYAFMAGGSIPLYETQYRVWSEALTKVKEIIKEDK